jgi:hypothetical protein
VGCTSNNNNEVVVKHSLGYKKEILMSSGKGAVLCIVGNNSRDILSRAG